MEKQPAGEGGRREPGWPGRASVSGKACWWRWGGGDEEAEPAAARPSVLGTSKRHGEEAGFDLPTPRPDPVPSARNKELFLEQCSRSGSGSNPDEALGFLGRRDAGRGHAKWGYGSCSDSHICCPLAMVFWFDVSRRHGRWRARAGRGHRVFGFA